ncbi:hypothetical protein B0H17DRAFT_1123766 [Mycena rosella]|uniref:Uncharacterized protein n=1 Tax=Mycena rosella TaxID=1033263 RepID=A0AAD7MD25_MYCRO|nr:hypothetical protein B0H17DRAFT_1123766 [Mycena rosella]
MPLCLVASVLSRTNSRPNLLQRVRSPRFQTDQTVLYDDHKRYFDQANECAKTLPPLVLWNDTLNLLSRAGILATLALFVIYQAFLNEGIHPAKRLGLFSAISVTFWPLGEFISVENTETGIDGVPGHSSKSIVGALLGRFVVDVSSHTVTQINSRAPICGEGSGIDPDGKTRLTRQSECEVAQTKFLEDPQDVYEHS